MAMVDVDNSCQFSADSQQWLPMSGIGSHRSGLTAQVGWLGLRVGGHPALSQYSSDEPGKLSQWLWSWWQHHKHCHGYYYYHYHLLQCIMWYIPVTPLNLVNWLTFACLLLALLVTCCFLFSLIDCCESLASCLWPWVESAAIAMLDMSYVLCYPQPTNKTSTHKPHDFVAP